MKRQDYRVPAIAWAVACSFSVALLAAASLLVGYGKAKASKHGSERVSRAVQAAESEINRTLLSVDVLLAGIDDFLRPTQLPNGRFDNERSHALLAGVLRRNLLVKDVSVLSMSGKVLATGTEAIARRGLNLPKGYLESVFSQATPTLVMTEPHENHLTAETVVHMARPITLISGEQAAVVAELPVATFSTLLSAGADLAGLSITVERADGALITSVPPSGHLKVSGPPVDFGQADGLPKIGRARPSGVAALVAARPSLYAGLSVTASSPLDTVFSDWKADRLRILIATIALVVLLVTTAGVTHWYWARFTSAQQEAANLTIAGRIDSLTGVANRAGFRHAVGRLLEDSQSLGVHAAVFYIDLDGFKAVNDQAGHAAGDTVLIDVAKSFQDALRGDDVVARLGGDEFAILARGPKNAVDAGAIAENLLRAATQIRVPNFPSLHIAASIGTCLLPSAIHTSVDEVIHAADTLMLRAKRAGKGRCHVEEQGNVRQIRA
jgi:diguanylate cyclase (GGDEF)-like protein